MKKHMGGRAALLVAGAAVAVAAIAPAAAQAAVTATVTGDDGNPVPLGGALNIRNMSPGVSIAGTAGEQIKASVTGPNGARVASGLDCLPSTQNQSVDYVGNGTYTVTATPYASTDFSCTGAPVGATQSLPFNITASTAFGPVPAAALTRRPGQSIPNTLPIGIDLNPGALSTEVWYERGAPPNPDGSLPGAVTQAFPDTTARTVGIRLDKGPGVYYVAGHAKGFTGLYNPQVFAPWATTAVRTFAPFDLQRFRWTDSRGPSYRLSATVRATGASGRVNIALGRGSKGKYRSLGTVKIRKHKFSKRFRITKLGKYRIRFKYKGNSTVAPGFEVHKFQITRRVVFRGAAAGAGDVTHGSSLGR